MGGVWLMRMYQMIPDNGLFSYPQPLCVFNCSIGVIGFINGLENGKQRYEKIDTAKPLFELVDETTPKPASGAGAMMGEGAKYNIDQFIRDNCLFENNDESNKLAEEMGDKRLDALVGETESLLNDSLGKVLFIDEAYSLVNDEKDSFGREALTVLNRFMSEY